MRWFGAVQAQDYLGSLWALGLRTHGATESSVEQAIADRAIVRTWPLRGTLHFVAAEDARWMLDLCAPRTLSRNASRLRREHGVDSRVVTRSRKVLTDALRGGVCMSRPEVYKRLESARIATGGSRGLHLLWWHAHEGLVCLGPRAGKQQTFALMDQWLPTTPARPREQSLAELARRYFTSHGPATVRDFAWWSGLATSDAELALEMVAGELLAVTVEKRTYWQAPGAATARPSSSCHLLPAYDEYTVAYQDRGAVLSSELASRADAGHGIFHPSIVIDGQIAGTWSRELEKDSVAITCRLFAPVDRRQSQAIAAAARRYAEFLGLKLRLLPSRPRGAASR